MADGNIFIDLLQDQVVNPDMWIKAYNKYDDIDEAKYELKDALENWQIFTEDVASLIMSLVALVKDYQIVTKVDAGELQDEPLGHA